MVALDVDTSYTRYGILGGGQETGPYRGGYLARLAGFPEQGEGRSLDEAIACLAARLCQWVEEWDAEADEEAHRVQELAEPRLITTVRPLIRDGRLHEELQASAPEPVLEPTDERAAREAQRV